MNTSETVICATVSFGDLAGFIDHPNPRVHLHSQLHLQDLSELSAGFLPRGYVNVRAGAALVIRAAGQDEVEYMLSYGEADLRSSRARNTSWCTAGTRATVPVTEAHGPTYGPTFGLVTAMPEEFHAMRALLDGPVVTRVAGDHADYVVGTLPSLDGRRPHKVVLTLTGDTGTHATADACKGLAMSFPTVNVVIMAGIAAGVPAPLVPDTHIRLGDVVVATWGVVDYGHIVRGADGDELRRPFPRPAALLIRADRMLQAGEHAGDRPWEKWLDIAGHRELASFHRPPDDTDVLGDGPSHPARHLSGHRRGLPKVHRGRIGSGDVSLRCSNGRDALASRYGLLAFEMEGAGIGNSCFLNGLDWFMVRGISDYGDENLGMRWRRYASLTAAAYVRALLEVTSPIAPRGGHPLAIDPAPRPARRLRTVRSAAA